MSVIAILSTFFLGPLKWIVEIVFGSINKVLHNPGWSVVMLCLAMNFLMLLLYSRVDTIRKNHSWIKSTAVLLLELPFFLAVSWFLSNVQVLAGASFGPIKDLGACDGLIGGINLLPVTMTLVGLLSVTLSLKGSSLAEKLLLYGTTLLFGVLIYKAPAAVALYWTINNLFFILRTLVLKLKCPKKLLNILLCLVGVALMIWGYYVADMVQLKRGLLMVIAGGLCLLPVILSSDGASKWLKLALGEPKPDWKKILLGTCLLTVLVGLLIPSSVLSASPEKFVDLLCFHHPLWYLVSTACLAGGSFLLWMNVIYALAGPVGKVLLERLSWAAGAAMVVCYFFFGTKLGPISAQLQYEEEFYFHIAPQLFNLLVMGLVAVAVYILARKWGRLGSVAMLAAVLVLTGLSVSNGIKIHRGVEPLVVEAAKEEQPFRLSKGGRNVILLTLDRAAAEYIPYIFNEKPELKEQFDGFTFYENTLALSSDTMTSISSIYGGYEYSPVEMNRRDGELLVDKHNEALKVLPVLFLDEGFQVTICNPVFTNYRWEPDMSVFDDYPQINTVTEQVMYQNLAAKRQVIRSNYHNFFSFSLMKTLPLTLQTVLYDNGGYNRMASREDKTGTQTFIDVSQAQGTNWRFESNYEIMHNLSRKTQILETAENTYTYMNNELPMIPTLLQTPDYVPAENVDNRAYDEAHQDRFTLDGKTIQMTTKDQITHYHVNMATILQLGSWFDYLRECGVYDNTRIILVSDHSWCLFSNEDLILGGKDPLKNVELYNSLLMVKDFDAEGFTTSADFMTIADVPTLAMTGLIENPVNPFTGNPINTDEKTAHDQFVLTNWDKNNRKGTYTFPPCKWASVHDDVRNPENWTFFDEEIVLVENMFP